MKLIELDSINLSFKKQNIFKDFSYTFNDVGLYLLFGPSGSGKTTLLNILIGQQKIDYGKYYYKGNLFEDNIETNIDDFAYFTQSTYYIDYLTIEDNLKLCSNDSDVINYWLDYFSLPNILHKYPNELSGGEKQRLSLILGLIQNKKVFLLDEPTSSLDKAQAKIQYECIKKLSKNVLVILVSHDSRSKEYCDEIIDFTNLKKYQSKMEITHSSKFIETKNFRKKNLTLLYKSISKQKFPMQNVIFLLFVFCILLTCFVLNPKEKIRDYIFNVNKINYLKVYCNDDNLINKLINNENITEIVYPYKDNISTYKGELPSIDSVISKNNQVSENVLKTAVYGTLPMNYQCVSVDLSDLYGSYFKKTNDIILGYNRAIELFKSVDNAIGKTLVIETTFGEQEFTVVGVYNPNNTNIQNYLSFGIIQSEIYNDTIYFNSEFSSLFYDDGLLSDVQKMNYHYNIYDVYFKSTQDLVNFFNEYKNKEYGEILYIKDPIENKLDLFIKIENTSNYIMPIVLILLIIIISFYLFMNWIYLSNNTYLLSVFILYGYSVKQVKLIYMLEYLFRIIKYFISSFGISLVLAIMLNKLNYHFNFFDFKIFSFSWIVTLLLCLYIISISIFFTWLMIRKIKINTWFDLLKEKGDLL